MEDPYTVFIESRIDAGESFETIRERLNDVFADASELCRVCRSRRATVLCDGLIGGTAGVDRTIERVGRSQRYAQVTKKNLKFYARNPEFWTCDLPMCEGCAIRVGSMFWDGKMSRNDTHDHSPGCERRRVHGTYQARPMDIEDANRTRVEWWSDFSMRMIAR